MKSPDHHIKALLIKKSNIDLIKTVEPTSSLQEIRGQKNMLKHHHKDTISKMEMWEILQDTYHLMSSTDKLQDKTTWRETSSLKEI